MSPRLVALVEARGTLRDRHGAVAGRVSSRESNPDSWTRTTDASKRRSSGVCYVLYGIFGDIHGNLQAWETVHAEMVSAGVERWLCLGDLVGYGANPSEVMEHVQEIGAVTVAGNHDWGVSGRLSLEYFNQQARAAIHWTRERLSEAQIKWLDDLPLLATADELSLAHATLHDPGDFDYLQTPYDAYLSFQAMETSVAFVGHSHVPVTFFDGTPVIYSLEDVIEFDDRKAIANVGSVGQPRDEDPRAAYGIYDSDKRALSIHRVEYDIEEAATRILDAGLPPILAERLYVGR